jgi:hypothetical protein
MQPYSPLHGLALGLGVVYRRIVPRQGDVDIFAFNLQRKGADGKTAWNIRTAPIP